MGIKLLIQHIELWNWINNCNISSRQLSFRTHFHNFISAYGSNDHRRSGQTAANVAAVPDPRDAKRREEETKLHSTAKSDWEEERPPYLLSECGFDSSSSGDTKTPRS